VSLLLRCIVIAVPAGRRGVVLRDRGQYTNVPAQRSQGTQGLSHGADAHRLPRRGVGSGQMNGTPPKPLVKERNRLQISRSAPGVCSPKADWRRPWLPQKCGLWQQPHARPGDSRRMERSIDPRRLSPVPCRLVSAATSAQPGHREGVNDTACTRRQSMPSLAPTAPARRLQQLSVGVGQAPRTREGMQACTGQAWWLGRNSQQQ
jgi:hypothetical protein